MGIQNSCRKIPLIFLTIFLCNFARSTADNEAKKAVIVCSYLEWAEFRRGEGQYTIQDIPVNHCTHIRYAFIGLNYWNVEILNRQLTSLEQLRNLKKLHPHLKLDAAITGIDAGIFSQMLLKFERRQKFIESIMKFLTEFNFDGISMVNSSQEFGDKENFLNLILELKAAFNIANKGWKLVISMPVSEAKLNLGYQLLELCQVADLIYAGTFDLRGNWQGFTDVPAPLRRRPHDVKEFKDLNVRDGAEILVQKGCLQSKIVISVSFTGRSYILPEGSTNFGVGVKTNVSTNGVPGPWLNVDGVLGYNEICHEFLGNKSKSWSKNWNNLGKSPFMYKNLVWVGYEDPDSIQYKMEFIRDKGFAGAMIWSIDTDDFKDFCGYGKNILSFLVHRHLKDYVVP